MMLSWSRYCLSANKNFILGHGKSRRKRYQKDIARSVARDGTILLKNDANVLPLVRPISILVVGKDFIANPTGAFACRDRGCNKGTLGVSWRSGIVDYPYLIFPLEAIRALAKQDEMQIVTSSSNSLKEGAKAATDYEIAIVWVKGNFRDDYITVDDVARDRPNLNH